MDAGSQAGTTAWLLACSLFLMLYLADARIRTCLPPPRMPCVPVSYRRIRNRTAHERADLPPRPILPIPPDWPNRGSPRQHESRNRARIEEISLRLSAGHPESNSIPIIALGPQRRGNTTERSREAGGTLPAMSKPNLLTASFRATTYKTSRGVAFPEPLFRAFGFDKHGNSVLIQTLSGETLYCGPTKFISGSEITEARACRKPGFSQAVVVTVSRGA